MHITKCCSVGVLLFVTEDRYSKFLMLPGMFTFVMTSSSPNSQVKRTFYIDLNIIRQLWMSFQENSFFLAPSNHISRHYLQVDHKHFTFIPTRQTDSS
jgi:hypothetical protein